MLLKQSTIDFNTDKLLLTPNWIGFIRSMGKCILTDINTYHRWHQHCKIVPQWGELEWVGTPLGKMDYTYQCDGLSIGSHVCYGWPWGRPRDQEWWEWLIWDGVIRFHHIGKYGPFSSPGNANSSLFPPNFWHYFTTLVLSIVSMYIGK